MTKEKFLNYLDDEEIQKKIKEIALSQENDEIRDANKEEELMKIIEAWKQKYQQIKESKNTQQAKIEELEAKNTNISQINANLEEELTKKSSQVSSLNEQNKKMQQQLDFYKQNFEDELKIYEKFTSLSDETKDSLRGIFKDDSLSGFMSCGVQEKNIQNFWEYIKAEILEDKNSDIEKLVEIFYFFFARFHIAYPMYELLNTKQNDSFDTQLHIKHNSSSSNSGMISKVYLQGYKNIKTDKTIKQSVVKI